MQLVQLLIIYSAFVKYLKKKWEYNKAVYQVFIDFKKTYVSVSMEVSYNILTEFGIQIKLVRLIKLCLNEMYSRVCVGKNLSGMLPIENVLKQGDAISPLFLNISLDTPLGVFR
jgi:hypothetical protein